MRYFKAFFDDRFLKKFVKGSFLANIGYLIAGNGLVFLISFCTTPLLSRIYEPSIYGELSLYMAIVQTIGILSTLQFTRVFILATSEQELRSIVRLSLLLLVSITALTFIFLYFSSSLWIELINKPNTRRWLFIAPAGAFFLGFFDIVRSLNEREKKFQVIAKGRVLSILTSKMSSVAYGFFISPSFIGLFLGELIVRPVEILSQLPGKFVKTYCRPIGRSFKDLSLTFKKYRTTPLFYLPAVWVVSFSSQLPIYLLSFLYSSSDVGFFSMANSILNIPLTLLVSSIAPVFTQKMAEIGTSDLTKTAELLKRMTVKLFYLGLIPNLILLFFARPMFSILLGKQWEEAGRIASYMTLYYLVLCLSSVYGLYLIFRKDNLYLLTNVFNIVLVAGCFWGSYYFFKDALMSIFVYSVSMLAVTVLHLYNCFKFSGLNFFREMKIPTIIVVCILIYQLISLVLTNA